MEHNIYFETNKGQDDSAIDAKKELTTSESHEYHFTDILATHWRVVASIREEERARDTTLFILDFTTVYEVGVAMIERQHLRYTVTSRERLNLLMNYSSNQPN